MNYKIYKFKVVAIMEVRVTHFSNPFSFFLKEKVQNDESYQILKDDNSCELQNAYSKKQWLDVNHGKYVAVWHQSKWARGILQMESQVLIWLIDCGHYIRPDDTMVYVDLPAEFKKLPTKIFEASVHGVVPIDKALSDDCEIKDVFSTTCNKGSTEKGQQLINDSKAIYFVPIALLCTKANDVVLGDLYLDTSQVVVNFVDLMKLWPGHLQRNPAIYIENISKFYSNRRKHHACNLKPVVPRELPVLSPTTIQLCEYEAIAKDAPRLELPDSVDSCSDGGSTVIINAQDNHLTAEEIEEYSQTYIKVNGIEYNVLNIILNKYRDLSMCEKYKNKKSVGRATTRRSTFCDSQSSILDEF